MPFSAVSPIYGPDTIALMAEALDAACSTKTASQAARATMALRIMAAVDAGERDPQRLKFAALDQVERPQPCQKPVSARFAG